MLVNTTPKSTFVLSLVAVFCFAAVALRAGETPSPREADQYRLKARQTFQRHSAEMRARDEAWRNLSAAEREKALQPIRERAERASAEMIQTALQEEAASPASEACPYPGLRYLDREPAVPLLFHAWEFMALNYWGNASKDSCEGVYAGYSPENPRQGELAVYHYPDEPWRYDLYPTPTATGPIHVVGEANGLLILSSVSGTFDEVDRSPAPGDLAFKSTRVPGGATYFFDLHTLRYR